MPVETQAKGKTYPPYEYEVGKEKIREYAQAVGEDNRVYYDREGDRIVSESYEDWRGGRISNGGLRPYANGAGEVDMWRLELVLNDLGKGFLAVEQFVRGDGWILTPQERGE